MRLAREVSSWSKDPGTHVGAVIVGDDRRILSTGYNGFPAGIADSPERLEDRTFKIRHTVHAELNAILNASKKGVGLEGSAIYVHGLPPCSACAKAVVQAGIRRVYYCSPIAKDAWEEEWAYSSRIFDECGVHWEALPDS